MQTHYDLIAIVYVTFTCKCNFSFLWNTWTLISIMLLQKESDRNEWEKLIQSPGILTYVNFYDPAKLRYYGNFFLTSDSNILPSS